MPGRASDQRRPSRSGATTQGIAVTSPPRRDMRLRGGGRIETGTPRGTSYTVPRADRVACRSLFLLAGVVGMTTYHGGPQLDRAQAMLDQHAVSSGDGLCVECGVLGPCPAHEAAALVFARAARLPRRRPGATRPELAGAKRVSFDWLPKRTG